MLWPAPSATADFTGTSMWCSGFEGGRLVGEVFAGRGVSVVAAAFSKRLLTSGSVQPRHHMGATGRTLGSAAALI